MMQSDNKSFNQWRSLLWPIHYYELKKFLPLFLMSFLFTFIYSVLRNTKDALLMTAPGGGGAEAIPFLTIIAIIPVLIFALIYAKLSNLLSKEKLFIVFLLPFLIFFPLFAFVLYPNKELLHPIQLADSLANWLPAGFLGLIVSFRNWTFAIFYIIEELWASFGISVLFWGLANDITKITEAKRFYVLLGLSANLGTLLSGPVIKIFLSFSQSSLSPDINSFDTSIGYLMQLCLILGILILCIYRWLNKAVITDVRYFNPEEQIKIKTERPKLSLGESIKFLMSSRYILCIAILIISYQIVINNSEVIWKDQLRIAFPDPGSYLEFMSNYSILLGCISTFTMLFISNNILRIWGWTFATFLTPLLLLLCGSLFFALIIFEPSTTLLISNFTISPLTIAVFIGTTQNIISKTSKYAFFDPTKEMAYIPLDQESKVKGKAIVDSLGSRLGKAIGSIMQVMMISIFGSLAQATPSIALIMFVVICVWIWAIRELSYKVSPTAKLEPLILQTNNVV